MAQRTDRSVGSHVEAGLVLKQAWVRGLTRVVPAEIYFYLPILSKNARAKSCAVRGG